ncbi:MAG: hypothetical protein AAGD07_21905 [Planctomycetota bacterium]
MTKGVQGRFDNPQRDKHILKTRFVRKSPMTQMMLFDAPVNHAETLRPVPQPVSSDEPSLLDLARSIRQARQQLRGQQNAAARGRQARRFGELAQMVLHRHDLVARRRGSLAIQTSATDAIPSQAT